MTRRLTIGEFDRARDQLRMSFNLEDLRFTTTYWYGDVDLYELEEQYGRSFMEQVYFHIAAFEVNKVCSLRPIELDLGPFSHLYTSQFETLWRTVFRNVWAQWRYEHNLPSYDGPRIISRPKQSSTEPVAIESSTSDVLAFCGGGKDSLVAMKLLEEAGVAYSSYVYSHSVYGRSATQHELIDSLLGHCSPVRRHKLWVYDDFMDAPVVELRDEFGVRSILAAETPSSIFGALPVLLQHKYQYIALAHERSANTGNLIWDKTGEEVNHQWGKSLEAENLINRYLRDALISNMSYFSVLQPLHDVAIFSMLKRYLDCVPATHSCNVAKPWCKRCPKCAYVWLNYLAYLPTENVDAMFQENLFDLEENQLAFRQMIGLEEHTPFECIGQIEEARLAFELCQRKGLGGRAMDTYLNEIGTTDANEVLDRFLRMHHANIPVPVADRLLPVMTEVMGDVRQSLLPQHAEG